MMPFLVFSHLTLWLELVEGNLIFRCMGNWEKYFRSIGRQNINNNLKLQDRYF